jgi:hypothetical protein
LAACQGRYIHSASSSTMCCCSARGRNSTKLHWWLQRQKCNKKNCVTRDMQHSSFMQ